MTSPAYDQSAAGRPIQFRAPRELALERSMFHLSAELAAIEDLPQVARVAVFGLSSLFGTRAVSLVVLDRPENRPRVVASTLLDAARAGCALGCDPRPLLAMRRTRRTRRAAELGPASSELGRRLAELEGDWVVPLLRREELLGLLVVGPKPDGGSCSEAELDLLRLLAGQLAVLVESARLLETATYEDLTGALRRETVLCLLEREVDRLHRYGRPLAVLLVDLDLFKQVNDRHGHLAGDALLRGVAGAFSARLRRSDLLGRFGGDELLVVLPHTGEAPARRVAEDLRGAAAGAAVTTGSGEPVSVTVSIGGTVVDGLEPDRAPGTEHLLTAADAALYQAKREGRDRAVFLPPPARLVTGPARRRGLPDQAGRTG